MLLLRKHVWETRGGGRERERLTDYYGSGHGVGGHGYGGNSYGHGGSWLWRFMVMIMVLAINGNGYAHGLEVTDSQLRSWWSGFSDLW